MIRREILDASKRIRVDASAGAIATFTRSLIKYSGLVSSRHEADVMRCLIRNFTSKKTDKMAFIAFRRNYDNPDPAHIRDTITILSNMIEGLKNFK